MQIQGLRYSKLEVGLCNETGNGRALLKAAWQGVRLLFILWLQVSLPPTLPSCFKQQANELCLSICLTVFRFVHSSLYQTDRNAITNRSLYLPYHVLPKFLVHHKPLVESLKYLLLFSLILTVRNLQHLTYLTTYLKQLYCFQFQIQAIILRVSEI